MKKLLCLTLAISLLLSACSPKTTENNTETPPEIVGTEELSGEITVSSYETMDSKAFLEETAKAFETKYPNTKINVDTFSALPEVKTSTGADGTEMAISFVEENSEGERDYLNRINTQLMSGEGPDILAMDVLPEYKYAENGQLENLSNYMDADSSFNKDEYLTNIFEATQHNGANYFLPLDYVFDYYAYDSSLVDEQAAQALTSDDFLTISKLVNLGKDTFQSQSSEDVSAMFSLDPIRMFKHMFAESLENFIDLQNKTANFNDGSFKDLLETVKGYSEAGYLLPVFDYKSQENMDDFIAQMDAIQNQKNVFHLNSNFNLSEKYQVKNDKTMVFSIGGGNQENAEIAGLIKNSNGKAAFEYQQAYGINSNSKNKALAWEFMKFMLSEEAQLSTNLWPTSLPVNNSARDKKAELLLSQQLFTAMATTSFSENTAEENELTEDEEIIRPGGMPEGAELEENPESVETPEEALASKEKLSENTKLYKTLIEDLSGQLNYYQISDSAIDNMIDSEVEFFFDGSKTADEVAESLQSKVTLYLNE